MSDQGAPRIEFPCRYPIKVMGRNADDFAALVLAVGQRHAPELGLDDLSVRESRNGRWVAVTLTIEAQSTAQIKGLFAELEATGRVSLVL